MNTLVIDRAAAPIAEWLVARVASYLDRSPRDVDPTLPLAEIGIDSVSAVSICGEIEDRWEIELDDTVVFDYPTIVELSEFIALEAELAARAA